MKKVSFYLVGLWLNVLSYLVPKRAGKKTFNLFCYPSRVPMKDYQLEFLNNAKFETLKTSRDTIQTYRWGNGPKKILFLHGWRSHTFRWKKYIESLSHQEYTIYALDAPGHGLSTGNNLNVLYYGEVIEQFINRLNGVETIVSHSMGGFSSLCALHRTQTLPVGNLVLMGTPGQAKEFIEYYRALLSLSDRTMQLMNEYFKVNIGFDPSYFSGPEFAKSISLPGLIIHDEEDLEAPIHNAREIHDAWPASSMIVTQGLGHNLRSKEVLDYVQQFLKGTGERKMEKEKLEQVY
jgi:pimeloyl-ACP methyl ester carboxylesterase